ncbi:hypothetical protein [Yinghuangia sp. YIM S10712]|uniref:hypothetical protein n=1 Tax=Yinghuangia sp. YIM S10712 TaxID=3436930 RepID=UPI003F535285
MTLTLRGYDDAPDLRKYPIERLDLKFWSGMAEIQQVSEDTIHDVFGFYVPVAEALPEGFHAGAPWPVITLPAGKDAAVLVVFRDGEYDAGIDYLVRETPDAEALLIGSCDTASPATGLMWTELSRVARPPIRPGKSPKASARSLGGAADATATAACSPRSSTAVLLAS